MLEQFKYDGSRKPDFQTLPTKVDLDWEPSGDTVPETDEEAVIAEEPETAETTESGAGIRAFLKEKAKANLVEIGNLQKALRSAQKRGVLILLHGLPYSGRAETGNFLNKGMKKGVKTAVYREGEHLHDFLWQMHRCTPKYGNICIMKGSVYADIPGDAWGAEKVRAFEKYLQESGIAVVRIFLHVSPKCQKNRMLEVLTVKPGAKPRHIPQDKGWRKRYLEDFANIVGAATPDTPWYIVPADDKWYARCAVTEIVRDALRLCVEEGTAELEVSATPEASEAEAYAAQDMAEPEAASAQDTAADTGTPLTQDTAVSGDSSTQDMTDSEAASAQDASDTEAASTQDTTAPEVSAAQAPAEDQEPARSEVKADEPLKTAEPEPAPAKKETTRRRRRQGPPKTVEETLARRRKKKESEG